MFFITKACVFCIFVVIRGEGQSLEKSLRLFLTNLQAVGSCLWPVRTLHKPNQHFEYACVKKLSLLPFRDKQIYEDLNQEVIFAL